jgi:hypothetical protein
MENPGSSYRGSLSNYAKDPISKELDKQFIELIR